MIMGDAAAKDAKERLYARLKWPSVLFGLTVGLYAALLNGSWIWFSWHPFLMSIVCLTMATLGTLLKKIGGLENTRWHAKILTAGAAMLWFAFYVIYTNKEMMGKPHFMTLHAKIGLVVLAGFTFAIPGLNATIHPDFGKAKTNQTVRFMHRWSGRFLIGMSWLACFTGFITMESNIWLQAMVALPLMFCVPLVLF
mmetsp:Transcript_5366/g.11072  ORF Transcript_5366/g.11072 Transcript_5366/m.11072 type:complete len:196 (-) Transcript_5366:4003-4590(-)